MVFCVSAHPGHPLSFVHCSPRRRRTIGSFFPGDRLTYNVAIDPRRCWWDALAAEQGISGVPHSFVIDNKGKLFWHGNSADKGLAIAIQKAGM